MHGGQLSARRRPADCPLTEFPPAGVEEVGGWTGGGRVWGPEGGNQYAATAASFKSRLTPGLSEEAQRCILSAVSNVTAIEENHNWR